MNKLPLLNTTMIASLVRAVLLMLFARFGWEIADQQLGEIAAWIATGAMIFGSLLWSWLSDKNVASGKVKPISLPGSPVLALLMLCLIAPLALTACSPHQRASLNATSLNATESSKNKAVMAEDGWTIESDQQLTGYTISADGIDAATEGQFSTATLGDTGLVLNSPANVKAGKIVYRSKKPVFITDEDGNRTLVTVTDPRSGELIPLISEQAIDVTDYSNDNTGNLAEFTKRQGAQVQYAITLAQTNVEKYREYMATIRATAPELADVIEGIVKAFVPAAAVIP